MSDKHFRRQERWNLDRVAGLASHVKDLRVRLQYSQGMSDNAAEAEAALEPLHGAHNSAAMARRLIREDAQLLIDPDARGWRS